jgi:hypothetical protein
LLLPVAAEAERPAARPVEDVVLADQPVDAKGGEGEQDELPPVGNLR